MFKPLRSLAIALAVGIGWTLPAIAQVVTPTSGTGDVGTIVSGSDPFVITGGSQRLDTLFQSFEEFSPGTADVIFDLKAYPTTETVIGRVTGSNFSFIDGQLAIDGGNSPDLFLINPNGITFGESASLLIPGSFFASTAESITFDSETAFSASNPENAPLLTVSTPTGIQFGQQASPITLSGSNLSVNAGEFFHLIGGDIALSGSSLSAEGGQIAIGSVTPGSQLKFGDSVLPINYADATGFQDINLTAQASVDASGPGGGRIQIQGRQINLSENSAIRTETSGDQAGQALTLRGSEQVTMFADSYDPAVRTVLSTSTGDSSTGSGGDLTIEAPFLRVGDFAWVEAAVSGSGDGGNITIRANTVEVVSAAVDDFSFAEIRAGVQSGGTGQGGNFELYADELIATDALIGTSSSGKGDAGNVRVEVDSLVLLEGAQLQTLTFGEGDAGDMVVEATQFADLNGITSFPIFGLGPASSGLFASAEPGSTGAGGSIRIEAPVIRVIEGGKIAVNALGEGDGGSITIRATDIEVSDAVVDFVGGLSGIVASSEGGSTGKAGSIDIEAERLRVFDGGQILSSAFGAGEAGNIDIEADTIDVTGISDDGLYVSQIAATADTPQQAGSVKIDADYLSVRNSAEINVTNEGTGNAGNLRATARTIFLDNGGSLRAEVNGGSQGNIFLEATDALLLRRGSNITTNAQGASTGGNINIDGRLIVAIPSENSDIVANAVEGAGGNIAITTQGLFGLEFQEQLTPESDITASSELGVSGTVEINNLTVGSELSGVELPSAPTDADNQIASACSSGTGNQFIASGRGGLPVSPTAVLTGNRPWSDIRSLLHPNEATSNTIAVDNPSQNPASANFPELVEASGWEITQEGRVELLATDHTLESFTEANCLALSTSDA